MKLEILGSGSKGNCYLLHNEEECLILEAGVPFDSVLRALSGDIGKIKGCLVSHEHKDHSKFVKEHLDHAVRVFATEGTCEAMKGWTKSKVRSTIPMADILKLGNFYVKKFKTKHDAVDPCGFLIKHPEVGVLLFVTDSEYIPCKFKGLTNIMIEANYDEELLQARDIPDSLKERIRGSHMSVDTCIEALKSNDLSRVNNIVLIHISEGDGDPEAFQRKVQEETGKTVMSAVSGMSIEINSTPF